LPDLGISIGLAVAGRVSQRRVDTLMLDEQIKALPVVDALGNSKG
jgi:hypothetical protein